MHLSISSSSPLTPLVCFPPLYLRQEDQSELSFIRIQCWGMKSVFGPKNDGSISWFIVLVPSDCIWQCKAVHRIHRATRFDAIVRTVTVLIFFSFEISVFKTCLCAFLLICLLRLPSEWERGEHKCINLMPLLQYLLLCCCTISSASSSSALFGCAALATVRVCS